MQVQPANEWTLWHEHGEDYTNEPRMRRMQLEVIGDGDNSLLRVAARHAFKHMTVDHIKKLWLLRKPYGGARPVTLRPLLRGLCEQILGPLTDGAFNELLKHRARPLPGVGSGAAEANPELLEEYCADGEGEQLKGEAVETKKKRRTAENADQDEVSHVEAAQEETAETPVEPPAVVPPAVPGGGSSSAGARPFDARFYTSDEAKAWCPRAPGLTISLTGNKFWQVKYLNRTSLPRSHSRAFPAGDLPKHMEALEECLVWVWKVHMQENPNQDIVCPWALRGWDLPV